MMVPTSHLPPQVEHEAFHLGDPSRGATFQRMNVLARNWWAVLVRGLLALAFGVLALAWPSITLVALVFLFGAYAFAGGIFAIVSAVRLARQHERWGVIALEGVLGVLAGLAVYFVPAAAAVALLVLVAVWAIMTGILEIVAAVRLRKHIEGEWMLALSGVLSVVFGVLLFTRPAAGLLALVWLVAAYAIAFGVVMIGLAFRLRRLRSEFPTITRPAPTPTPSPA
jgi:uncharacterized membrane protein HdeD (DUF308 family)